jgi:hypothetical protein
LFAATTIWPYFCKQLEQGRDDSIANLSMWARKDLQEALQEHKIIKITFPDAKSSSLEGKITAIELSGITFEYEPLQRHACA